MEPEITIPEISDELLRERMERIKYVVPAMCNISGKPYSTSETDPNLYDLFYVETNVDPKKESFNFDENKRLAQKAIGLEKICTVDILVKIGGYYGFTFAEVMSQIPDDIKEDEIVAFALNPKEDPQILNEDYQSVSIIFYRKTDSPEDVKELPSATELIKLVKPVDKERALALKDRVQPIVKFEEEGYTYFSPGDIAKPFMYFGIWLSVNGSYILKSNESAPVKEDCIVGKEISIYQDIGDSPDIY
jgi:hypothetical protein